MSQIIGYSEVTDGFHWRASLTFDDNLTKEEIVRRGWAAGPLYLPWPLYDTPKDGYRYYGLREHSRFRDDLDAKKTFKYNGQYYTINRFIADRTPLSLPYWDVRLGVRNEYAIDIIMESMNAPVFYPYDSEDAYKIHWVTYGGERVDMKLWIYDKFKGIDDDHLGVYETTAIPGVGYSSALKDWVLDDHKEEVAEYGYLPRVTSVAYSSRTIHLYIHYPNCELGNDIVASYEVTTETTDDKQIISAKLSFKGIDQLKVRRVLMSRYQPRTATSAISCYVLNRTLVQRFVDTLYTKDIYDRVKAMLYGDGAGNILSLKWFYGVRPNLSTPKQTKVTIGNVSLDAVVAPVYNGDFVQVYMGYITIPREYGDYRDYTLVRYQAYIPMVGIIDLDPSQIVGRDLHLLYTVNLTDGSAVVNLSVSSLRDGNTPTLYKNGDWYEIQQPVFTTSITYGYEIPLNVDSIRTPSLLVGDIVSKAVFGGVAGALAGNYVGAAIGAVGGAVAGAAGGPETTYSVGSLTANSNVMEDFKPKLIRTIVKDQSGDISAAVGAPSGKVVRVGDARGYLKAAMVYGTPSSIMQHADEIENMLKEGIRIS